MILTGLVLVAGACVINTRPHLPDEDGDGGRFAAAFDAAAVTGAGDAGQAGAVADAATVDASLVPDAAPPPADAGTVEDVGAAESDDCFAADSERARDGGVRDGGVRDGSVRDGGDAGFIDPSGRACDPAQRARDAGAQDGGDVRSGS